MYGRGCGVLGVGIAAVCFLAEGRASAAPHHSGFTGDLGLGVGITTRPVTSFNECFSSNGGCGGKNSSSSSETSTAADFGLAPLALSIGGFLTPKVALLFRAAGTSYFVGNTQYINAFYGPVVEVWPHPVFFVGGGPGLGVFGANPLTSSYGRDPEGAFALDARAGFALIQGRNHDLTLSVEGIAGFYEETHMSLALIAAWKWY